MFIYVGGVPGAGKTTIISKTIGLAQKYGFKMKEAGGVPILCRLAGVETVSELRALPEKTRQKLRPKMEEELCDIDSQDPETIRIQDGHFVFFDYARKEYGTRLQVFIRRKWRAAAGIFLQGVQMIFKEMSKWLSTQGISCSLN